MNYILAIAVLVLTPILWLLAHKYFSFIYFGNIGNSIIKELLECFFIAILIVSAVGALLGKIFSFLGKAFLVILKIALIIAVIAFAIWLISFIVKKIKGSKGTNDTSSENVFSTETEESGSSAQTVPLNDLGKAESHVPQPKDSIGDASLNSSFTPPESSESEGVVNDIIEYIRQTYKKEDYIQALRYYREKTGADIRTAQDALAGIFGK